MKTPTPTTTPPPHDSPEYRAFREAMKGLTPEQLQHAKLYAIPAAQRLMTGAGKPAAEAKSDRGAT